MVHNRDRPKIYKNPLIECTITGLMGILKSGHKSYKLIKLLRYYLTIILFSQVILKLIQNRRCGFWHMALTVHFSILLLLLLLLAAKTCNQVQSFQIKACANHYVDIEITGYRVLYSKSIAGRDIARLISWLGTVGPVDCFNKSVSDCYIRVYRSF